MQARKHGYQAIMTKFIGPTNFKGSRLKAWCQAKTIIVDWDHALNPDENHYQAALKLFKALTWNENFKVSGFGALPKNFGYALTMSPKPRGKK